jgi:molybdate/tungstate transport system substrate-binding protein
LRRPAFFLLLAAILLGGCKPGRKEVLVFAAASLARAFSDLEEPFERAHPSLDLRLELGGSQELCRRVAELGRPADVVATADGVVIDQILRPRYARFNLLFTANEVTLAHGQHSRFTEEITVQRWPAILQRPGVRLGLVNPDTAPIGYRTVQVLELAERTLGAAGVGGAGLAARLRARTAPEHLAPDEGELLALLQARAVDYAFVYRSSAEDHNLKAVALPDAYNLGAAERAREYARVALRVKMKRSEAPREVRATPILYGLTIPTSAQNPSGGEAFVGFLLGEAGRRGLSRHGFRPLVPPRCDPPCEPPAALRALLRR